MTVDSSKEILIKLVGIYDVHSYERVKAMTMRLGNELAAALLKRVGGRVARHGEGCDGITHLGKWEFCMQKNTKNSHGADADQARCPGHCVQILGTPNDGWISGREFLHLHDVDPAELDIIIDTTLEKLAWPEQRRLPI